MKDNKQKRIVGGIALFGIGAISFIGLSLGQASAINCSTTGYQTVDIETECGITLDHKMNGSDIVPNEFILSMGNSCSGSFTAEIYDETKATIDPSDDTKVTLQPGAVIRSLGTISNGGSINITASDSDYSEIQSSGTPGIAIHVYSNGKVNASSCEVDGLDGYLSAGKASDGDITPPGACSSAPDPSLTGEGINCSGVDLNGTSFESKFCNAKEKALASGESFCDSSKDSRCKKPAFASGMKYSSTYGSDMLKFQCDSDVTKIPTKKEDLEGEKYYLNKNYVYGTSVFKESAEYIYNYSASNMQSETVSCEVTCEESVEVEYGPPVASKAGMCFEYKVRVTSRTSCYMSAPPPKPECPKGYCTPVPICRSSRGGVFNQGGPSEDFDACVKKCDGGKYSKSCSNKCYKQVYGNALAGAKVNGSDFFDMVASKVVDTAGKGNDAECTYDRIDGELRWSCGSRVEGRWYNTHWTGTSGGKNVYSLDDNGIYRHNLGGGRVCQDKCSWTGCKGDVYLNPDQDQIDYTSNLEKYENLLNSCQGQAVCSTETAEVSISVDYIKKNSGESVTINFPYTSGGGESSDRVTHNEGGTVTLPDESNSIILKDDPTDGEGILGCYKPGASETNLYRLTWSFPGTWINNKSGEISYTNQTSTCEGEGNCKWQKQKQKFCLPNNADRVNADWWNLYNKKIIDEEGIESSVFEESEVQEKCAGGSRTLSNTILNPGTSASVEKYNIHAKAVKFGYFAWNIQMDCFYAVNSTPLVPTTNTDTSNTPDECKTDPDNYRIRSIDLENVFPAKDGSTLSDPSSSGRMPGHNWTKYSNPGATSLNYNNPGYLTNSSDPISYLTKIQTTKEAVYDDDVEYEFYLSPKNIREIRSSSISSTNGYSNFDESQFYIDSNGVSRYYSNKIRSYGIANKINSNKTGGLTCNNMKSYSSDACE